MKKHSKTIFVVAIAALILASCAQTGAGGTTGALFVSFSVPNYGASAGASASRAIAPQTAFVVICANTEDSPIVSAKLSDFTSSGEGFATSYSKTFSLPATSYSKLLILLEDASKKILSKVDIGAVDIALGATTTLTGLHAVPADTKAIDVGGSIPAEIPAGSMVFFEFAAAEGSLYSAKATLASGSTGDISVVPISGLGVVQGESFSDAASITPSAAGSYYIGLYSLAGATASLRLDATTVVPASHLLINEISDESYGTNAIELYNPTASAIDISGYRFDVKRKYNSYNNKDTQTVSFPAKITPIPANGYVVVGPYWSSSNKLNPLNYSVNMQMGVSDGWYYPPCRFDYFSAGNVAIIERSWGSVINAASYFVPGSYYDYTYTQIADYHYGWPKQQYWTDGDDDGAIDSGEIQEVYAQTFDPANSWSVAGGQAELPSSCDIYKVYTKNTDGSFSFDHYSYPRKWLLANNWLSYSTALSYQKGLVNWVIPSVATTSGNQNSRIYLPQNIASGGAWALTLLDASGAPIDYLETGSYNLERMAGVSWLDDEHYISVSGSHHLARISVGGIAIESDSICDWRSNYGTLGFDNNTMSDQPLNLYVY